jgi:hypothetical protein
MGIFLSSVIGHDETLRVVWCTQDTVCIAGVSWDRIIMKYTQDEYCNMLLTLGTCNSRAGTAMMECALHYPGPRHPDSDMF